MTSVTSEDATAMTSETPFSFEDATSYSPQTSHTSGQCLLYEVIINFVVNGSMCIGGVVGNVMTCMIMWPERKKSATAFLLICLAINDGLLVIVWTIMRVLQTVTHVLPNSGVSHYMPYMRLYGWATGSFVHLSDSLIVILVTLQRYITVCHPHKAKNFNRVSVMKKMIVAILIFTIIFTIPRYTEAKVHWDGDLGKYLVRDEPWNNTTYNIIYSLILYYIIIYISPLLFLIYATTQLIISLHRNRRRRQEMTQYSRRQETLTLSLVMVVLVFLVCQLMNPLRRLLAEMIPRSKQSCGYATFYFSYLSSTFVIFNSFINFIIYSICSMQFRGKMKAIMCCIQCKVHPDISGRTELLSYERNRFPKPGSATNNCILIENISSRTSTACNKVAPLPETQRQGRELRATRS